MNRRFWGIGRGNALSVKVARKRMRPYRNPRKYRLTFIPIVLLSLILTGCAGSKLCYAAAQEKGWTGTGAVLWCYVPPQP